MKTIFIVQARLPRVDKKFCWMCSSHADFRADDRTFDELQDAARAKGYELCPNADVLVGMRGTARENELMHKIIDRAWSLAQEAFQMRDEPYRRKIEIDVVGAKIP